MSETPRPPGTEPLTADQETRAPEQPRPTRPARPTEIRNVVGVRFHPVGRTVEADAGELQLHPGDKVVLDDRRLGNPVVTVTVPSGRRATRPGIPRLLRRADGRDLSRETAERERLKDALTFAREKARARQLPIKVFRVESAPNTDRTTFYFSSEQRVDFRELVRDLAAHLHARIELRQVGVRDEAKMVGGIGTCGRELCCTTFLPHFAPVTIRMAKNQNIALTPTKVSGQCGRLKCCLVYEEAQYVEAGKKLPKLGKRVETPDGLGRVEDLDVLAGRIRVSFPDRPPATYTAEDVRPAAPPVAQEGEPRSPRPGRERGDRRGGRPPEAGPPDPTED